MKSNWFRTLIYIFLAFSLLTGSGDSQQRSLDDLKSDYLEATGAASAPFKVLEKRYVEELKKLAKSLQKEGKLEGLLAVNSEIKNYADSTPDFSAYPQLKKLRAIYDSEKAKIRKKAESDHTEALNAYIAGIESKIKSLTTEGKLDEAVHANDLKISLLAKLNSSMSTAEPPKAQPKPLSPGSSDSGGRNELKVLPMFAGQSGRLRVSGSFHWGESLLPPEVQEITDFVEVHAFEKCWVGIRESGEAVVYAWIGSREMRLRRERGFEIIGRTHDCWTVNRKGEFFREIEGPVTELSDVPDAIVGCHVGGIAVWDDGKTDAAGGAYKNGSLIPPPPGFFKGNTGVISGSLWILVRSPDGTVKGWDTKLGKPTEFPEVSGVVEMAPARNHALLRKANGDVQGVFLDGSKGPPDIRWAVPASVSGQAKRVRAGEHMSAIQKADGSWFCWGQNAGLVEEVNRLGPVMDLDLYANHNSGYIIWIETDDSPSVDQPAAKVGKSIFEVN